MSRILFHNSFRNNIFSHQASNFISKYYSSRSFNVRLPFQKINKANAYFSSAAVASAVALGFSIYISSKKNASCEAVEIAESKELIVPPDHHTFDEAICESRDLLQRVKGNFLLEFKALCPMGDICDECGAPGMVVGVSINGEVIWTEGLGYSDVENRVLCCSDTVMRIASISKSITMTAVAKLWEQGKLDLDKPVQDYVPYFPPKHFEKKPVTITCRQLVSHLGGIRHYDKSTNTSNVKKTEVIDEKSKKNDDSEFEAKEYYIKEHYKDVKSSLDIFKDDPLIANPGSKFYYSTHGWTLISAIVEAASKETFATHMTKLFKVLGMSSTYLDVNDALIYYRSRNYIKDKNGHLINAPYVDNSYKWAGGGFLSTVGDLLKFGNAMLYSLQYKPVISKQNENGSEQKAKNVDQHAVHNLSTKEINFSSRLMRPGYLNSKTVEKLWTPVTDTKDGKYGMGWSILPEVNECQFCESKTFIFHTGGAVGASSVLLILPESIKELNDFNLNCNPKGVVVVILTNLQSVSLHKTALKIAQIFDNESKHCLLAGVL